MEPTMDVRGRTLELALMVWLFLSWLPPWTTTGGDVFLVVVVVVMEETVVEAAEVVVMVGVEEGVVVAAVVVDVGVAIVVETVAIVVVTAAVVVVVVVTVLPRLLTIAALLMGESAATEFLQGVAAVFGGEQGLGLHCFTLLLVLEIVGAADVDTVEAEEEVERDRVLGVG